MRSMLLAAITTTFGLALITTSAPAEAGRATLYIGAHPVGDNVFCVIEAPHQHTVAPFNKALFRVHDGHHHFVGDPVAFGYAGPKHAYVGHHPIHMQARLGVWYRDPEHDEVYCYIEGPHYHGHAPSPTLEFKVKGDAYWYVGTFRPAYKRHRARYVRPVAAVYAEIDYPRPVITVTPPVGFVGVIATPSGVVAEGGITAGVEVIVPRPVVEVDLGFGVDIHGHGHGHRHYKHRKHRKHKKYRSHRRGKRWGYVRGDKTRKARKRRRR
jgi:hypothetical protein